MAHYVSDQPDERTELGDRAGTFAALSVVVGVCSLVLALIASVVFAFGSEEHFFFHLFKRFMHGYLLAYVFAASIAVGALFFLLVSHLFRAGWSVNVRRPFEALAAQFPLLGILLIPILISVVLQQGELYPWAQPLSALEHHEEHPEPTHRGTDDVLVPTGPEADAEPAAEDGHAAPTDADADALTAVDDHGFSAYGEDVEGSDAVAAEGHEPVLVGEAAGWQDHPKVFDELTEVKRPYLNPLFFLVRMGLFFLFFGMVGRGYWRGSVTQDTDANPRHTSRMEAAAPVLTILFALVLTYFAFDLLMSLDPHWYSTIFGVYYFSGSALAVFAAVIISLNLLQRAGYLTKSVTVEHYHDLGKLLFVFVFFWGYIAFSQYMLLWYANIPETGVWLARRGATTVEANVNGWSWVAVAILFGHLLIPFGVLLSRHVKRHVGMLTFWAVWLLVFHWVDLWWVVGPEMQYGITLPVVEVLCTIGVCGIFVWGYVNTLAAARLRPVGDPRVGESFAFTNV